MLNRRSWASARAAPRAWEAVEKLFLGVRGERLIHLQARRREDDSDLLRRRFDCCAGAVSPRALQHSQPLADKIAAVNNGRRVGSWIDGRRRPGSRRLPVLSPKSRRNEASDGRETNMLGGGWIMPIARFAYAAAGDGRGERTRAGISSLQITLTSALPIALAACTGLPCPPASYYAPEAGAPYHAAEAHMQAPAGHTLAGTLTLPADRAVPLPDVVLISCASASDAGPATYP